MSLEKLAKEKWRTVEDWLPLVDALITVQPDRQTRWYHVVSGGVSVWADVIAVSTRAVHLSNVPSVSRVV